MLLIIQDGILCVRTPDRFIYAENINPLNTKYYLLTCGYQPIAANAIAYGALAERQTTITLAQLLKLLAAS